MSDMIWILFLGTAVIRMFISFMLTDPLLASSYRIESGLFFLIALVWMRRDRL